MLLYWCYEATAAQFVGVHLVAIIILGPGHMQPSTFDKGQPSYSANS